MDRPQSHTASFLILCLLVCRTRGIRIGEDDVASLSALLNLTVPPSFFPDEQIEVLAISDIHGVVMQRESRSGNKPDFYRNTPFDNMNDFLVSKFKDDIERHAADVFLYLGDAATTNYNSFNESRFCTDDAKWDIAQLLAWIRELPAERYPIKIIIPGNHDACYRENKPLGRYLRQHGFQSENAPDETFSSFMSRHGIIYIDSTQAIEIHKNVFSEPLKLLVSPYSECRPPPYLMGAFQYRPKGVGVESNELSYDKVVTELQEAAALFSKSPDRIDIFATHGPPDYVGTKYARAGDMLPAIQRLKPEFILMGHIHITSQLPILQRHELYISEVTFPEGNVSYGAVADKSNMSGLALDVALKYTRPEEREQIDFFTKRFSQRLVCVSGQAVGACIPDIVKDGTPQYAKGYSNIPPREIEMETSLVPTMDDGPTLTEQELASD